MSVGTGIKEFSRFQCNFTIWFIWVQPFIHLHFLEAAGDVGWADVCSGAFFLKVQPNHRQWEGWCFVFCIFFKFFFNPEWQKVFKQYSAEITVPLLIPRLSVHSLLRFPLCTTEIADAVMDLKIISLTILKGTIYWIFLSKKFHPHPHFPSPASSRIVLITQGVVPVGKVFWIKSFIVSPSG